ncbi:hypothetical protein BB14905_01895 [Bacillus sp. B14905]|nr:hypothetical protein BB14905_01895 [Bacillus sp. B14905]
MHELKLGELSTLLKLMTHRLAVNKEVKLFMDTTAFGDIFYYDNSYISL